METTLTQKAVVLAASSVIPAAGTAGRASGNRPVMFFGLIAMLTGTFTTKLTATFKAGSEEVAIKRVPAKAAAGRIAT